MDQPRTPTARCRAQTSAAKREPAIGRWAKLSVLAARGDAGRKRRLKIQQQRFGSSQSCHGCDYPYAYLLQHSTCLRSPATISVSRIHFETSYGCESTRIVSVTRHPTAVCAPTTTIGSTCVPARPQRQARPAPRATGRHAAHGHATPLLALRFAYGPGSQWYATCATTRRRAAARA